jgi:O-succinylhomoserine sulfhydrylase
MRPDTGLIRGGLTRSEFDETAEGLFLTSGYVYESAEEAEAAFAGDIDRFIYSRYGNPTIAMFEERLRRLEGAEGCWATASGMAAVFVSLVSLLEAGDRVVASRELFGSCFMILDELLPRFGVHTDFVSAASLDEWEQALDRPAKVVFFESPSNPMQTLVDVEAVATLAHDAGATVVVDNVFATPILQRPLELGADVVVYSTTKHIDGQGRTLGGAILGSEEYLTERVQPWMRHTGPSLSPFNAWVLVKSLETLALRVERQTDHAGRIAAWLEGQPSVRRVWYAGLPSHPQADLAARQMRGGGTVVTFEVEGGKAGAFALLNGLEVIDISNNLGDTKSLVTHPASTTDGVVRISVGLEDVADLIEDLERALGSG